MINSESCSRNRTSDLSDEEAVEQFIPLVKSIAYKFRRKDILASYEDLEQIGFMAVVLANRAWKAGKGAKLSTFIYGRVKNAIRNHIYNNGHHLSYPAYIAKQPQKAKLYDVCQLGKNSMNVPSGQMEPIEILGKKEDINELKLQILSLSTLTREIIYRHTFENESYDDIAEDLGISKPWTITLANRGIDVLKSRMNKE